MEKKMPESVIDQLDISVLQLDNLPIVDSFLKRLDVLKHIDSACPSRSNANVTHGQIIECLVANRLSSPRPLYDIQHWASTLAITEVFGVAPHELNDDRIARALDAIAGKIESIQGSIVASAISCFGLDASTIHWDLTSLFFCGDYPEDEQDPDFASITYGYSSRNFSKLKQVRAGCGVSADGGVPIWQKVFNGNENDVATVVRTLQSLKAQAKLSDFLMIGDSKLLSKENMLAFNRSGLTFLAPAASSKALDAEFLAIASNEFRTLDYLPESQARLPVEQRNTYLGCERQDSLRDPDTGESYIARKLFVISSEERDARRRNRERQMQKAALELEKLTRTAGSRFYPSAEKVLAKAAQILKEKRVSPWFVYDVKEQESKIVFSFSINSQALAATQALDGFYVLLTNIPSDQADPCEILCRYKGQHKVERRFKESKHALKVRPLFLSHNSRIETLVFVIGIALMIFALIEREARRNLSSPTDKVDDLLAGHVPARPTGENILKAFLGFHAIIVTCAGQRFFRLPPPRPVQAKLLSLLGVHQIRYG